MERNIIDLLCQLPGAASLQELCDMTYHITGNPVFVSDMTHTILSYTKSVEVDDPQWQQGIVGDELDANLLRQEVRDPKVARIPFFVDMQRHTMLLDDDNMPYERAIRSLRYEHQVVGILILTAYFEPFTDQTLMLMDLIATFMENKMAEEEFLWTSRRMAAENIFIKLLDGADYTAENLEKRLVAVGVPKMPCTYLLSVGLRRSSDVRRGRESVQKLIDPLREMPGCYSFIYQSSVVCILRTQEEVRNWETDAPKLMKWLKENELVAGASRKMKDLTRMKDYYAQAQQMLEVAACIDRVKVTVYNYDEYSVYLMFDKIPRENLIAFSHQKIRELEEYDLQHDGDLCVTLQVYLDQAKSLAKTAELLYIHRNTVRYRINKCQELLGSELEDGNEIFAFLLALRIREYLRKLPGCMNNP